MVKMKNCLIFALFFTTILTTACNSNQVVDIDKWIIPYSEIVEEINEENGWSLAIANTELFYDTYKNNTPEEAKEDIIRNYFEYLENQSDGFSAFETVPSNRSDFTESTHYHP